MRMLDLFCGRWGWSKAFAARGWECVGVDLVEPPEIPEGCTFVQADILTLNWRALNAYVEYDFICASSPCEQFSVHGMKHFHPNPPYPELGIKLFNHTRSICEASGVPYVMENVKAAQQFIGAAAHHCGPFYLWGNAVPPILHQGIKKDTRMLRGTDLVAAIKAGKTAKEARREWQTNFTTSAGGRRASIAQSATIPPELANCVAEYAERLLEQKSELAGDR